MKPLLQIKTIPLKYELKIQRAELKYNSSKTNMFEKNDKGGLEIQSRPSKLNMDTFNARNSVCPTTMTSVRQAAESGLQAAMEATATYAKEGAILLDPNISNPLDEINRQRAQMPTGEFSMRFLPTTGPDIEWSEPNMDIKYQMDKISFDIKVAKGDYEFIPGNVEVSITQMPDVEIEYIGEPLYVPPSARDFFQHAPFDVLA